MGCDGGSIPKRCEMVREKKKKEPKDRDMARKARWFNCAITQQRLILPIVSCRKGNLYNKEPVLEHILKINQSKVASHIKKSKDMKVLNLTLNPSLKNDNKLLTVAKALPDTQKVSQFVCPVTGVEMDGHHCFGFFWNCGCVMSSRALREVPSDLCHKCGKPATKEEFIEINSNNLKVEKPPSIVGKKRKQSHQKNSANAGDEDVAADSTASEVFKSLFTSSEEYKRDKKNRLKDDRTTYAYI